MSDEPRVRSTARWTPRWRRSGRGCGWRGARSRRVPGPSPPELRDRLRLLSDRFRGPQAIALRRQPIPHAYRVFFRHIGLEPDEQRIPVEALALERMKHGGFRSRSLLDDAITIAVMETARAGVGARRRARSTGTAAARVRRGRAARARRCRVDCPPGGSWWPTTTGRVAVLFGEVAPGAGVTRAPARSCCSPSRCPACLRYMSRRRCGRCGTSSRATR